VLVVPGLFAFADKVLGNLQLATFAAFGGFATLVLVSFGGSRRERLVAHLALALGGSALIVIGTAVSSTTVLAAAVTVPVAFVVFFAGAAGPNAAAGINGALLAYVLPAASPGTMAMIPDRLAGWWLASAAGTAAVLALSPAAPGDRLKPAAAEVADALAAAIEGALAGLREDRLSAAIQAKQRLLSAFTATPYRPTGLSTPDEALGNVIELLEWTTALVADMVRERADLSEVQGTERELLQEAARTLAHVATLLRGGRARAEPTALPHVRQRSIARLTELSAGGPAYPAEARVLFHADMIAVTAYSIEADTLVALRLAEPAWLARERERVFTGSTAVVLARRRLSAVLSVARRHASIRSVWLVNSLRGGVALGVAVLVADLSSVQHGFWVVLGTLSVLRTNAVATGATALRALEGTVIGFVIGGVVLVAIGAESSALWIVLPVAVAVAAYAPGTAPFELGQAAFTVTVAVLFNLLVPAGWNVGVVRVEDVAIGCAVSVVVGALFWPRGLASVVGDDLADAYRAGAYYLRQAVQWIANAQDEAADGAAAAAAAAARLDEALRGFLAEQGSKHVELPELWRLVGGALRLRLTAYSIAGLPRDRTLLGGAQEALIRRTATLAAWFERLAGVVGHRAGPAPPVSGPPTFGPGEKVSESSGSQYGVWLCEHLDHLAEHLADLVGPAADVAQARGRPWWG
jgi:uncharacterized membrane protein YccC